METQGMGDHCYVAAENLAKLSPEVMWKSELLSDEFGYKTKEISKKFVESEIWFLLNAHSKLKKGERYWGKTIKQKENRS